MTEINYITKDIGIPSDCIGLRTGIPNGFVCLVPESWVHSLRCGKFSPVKSYWYKANLGMLKYCLAPSYQNIEKPWTRISFEVIVKNEIKVESLVDELLSYSQHQLTSLEVQHQSNEKFWQTVEEEAVRKYHSAHVPMLKSKLVCNEDQSSVIGDIFKRLFGKVVVNISVKSQKPSKKAQILDLSTTPSLMECYAVLESTLAFYIIRPFVQFSLWDVLHFRPESISSNSHQLFILYQLVEAIRLCHSKNLSVGNLNTTRIFCDDEHWLKLEQPQVMSMYRFITNSDDVRKDSADIDNKVEQSSTTRTVYEQVIQKYASQSITSITMKWVHSDITNLEYLLVLNNLAGRSISDPNHYPVLPWVSDLSHPAGDLRDFAKSKFRLTKGEEQLDLTFSRPDSQVPHHVSDVLSDITYYVYTARQTPKEVLCKHVRKHWVPKEYPDSIERLYQWTPDECIPDFFIDPGIFKSVHEDMPDLMFPIWASSTEDFIKKHHDILESEEVSANLHEWIDLTFGYKLCGEAAIEAKNVCLQLASPSAELINHGIIQLFTVPHPHRLTTLVVYSPCDPRLKSHFETSNPSGGRQDEAASTSEKVAALRKFATLPESYDPLLLLRNIERLLTFCQSQGSLPALMNSNQNHTDDYSSMKSAALKSHDMQALACCITEILLPTFTRPWMLKDMKTKFIPYRNLCKQIWTQVPRPFHRLLQILFCINDDELHLVPNPYGALFFYQPLHEEQLPPINVDLILDFSTGILPYPKYFKSLYKLLTNLQILRRDMQEVLHKTWSGDFSKNMDVVDNLARQQVLLCYKFITSPPEGFSSEGIDLLLPFVKFLFDDKNCQVHAIWSLFSPLSMLLGPEKTAEHLLPYVMSVFDDEGTTPKHLKLYHCTFTKQLMIRLGTREFLTSIVPMLVEATAGYKNYKADNIVNRQINMMENTFMRGDIFESEEMCTDEVLFNIGDDGSADKIVPDQDTLSAQEDTLQSKAFDVNEDNVYAEDSSSLTKSNESEEPAEGALSRSVGEISVHSVSRLIQSYRQEQWQDEDKTHQPSVASQIQASNQTDDTIQQQSLLQSQEESNISDVAVETISWLAQHMGPVLTGRYLSKNLLRMLAVCYKGPEHQQGISWEGHSVSVSHRWVVGDTYAIQVLNALVAIVTLYGEEVIVLQYFQHMNELVNAAAGKLNDKTEGGLISCVVLLAKILPYLSDKKIVDVLQDEQLSQLILAILNIVTDVGKCFPSGFWPRKLTLYKLVDVVFIVGKRIGFENTRSLLLEVLCGILKKYSFVFRTPNITVATNRCDTGFEELKNVLTSDLAHLQYVTFCKLAGEIKINEAFKDDALMEFIRHLWAEHDQLSQQQSRDAMLILSTSSSSSGSTNADYNALVIGNRIQLHDVTTNPATIDVYAANITEELKFAQMGSSAMRHLRGNWLAYWEHEVGRDNEDLSIKQIRLLAYGGRDYGGHHGSVRSICVLDNENSFLTAGKDKTVKLWSLRSKGDGSTRDRSQWTYTSHSRSVYTVQFMEALRLAASCDGALHVWDPFVGQCLKTYEQSRGGIAVLQVFPPPFTTILTATGDSSVKILDVRCKQRVLDIKCIPTPLGLLRCATVSPHGQWVAIGHASGIISLLDIRAGKILAWWKAHDSEVLQLEAFGSQNFVSSSIDQSISMWRCDETIAQKQFKGIPEPIHCLRLFHNNIVTASPGNRVGVFSPLNDTDLYSSTKLKTDVFRGVLSSMAVLPLNKLILLGSDNGVITLIA